MVFEYMDHDLTGLAGAVLPASARARTCATLHTPLFLLTRPPVRAERPGVKFTPAQIKFYMKQCVAYAAPPPRLRGHVCACARTAPRVCALPR
jgi:hypothetical protein